MTNPFSLLGYFNWVELIFKTITNCDEKKRPHRGSDWKKRDVWGGEKKNKEKKTEEQVS